MSDSVESRCVEWLSNYKSLVNSSKSLIRRKRSPLARAIAMGNSGAILKAAYSRVVGSMTALKRASFCKAICELKLRLKGKTGSDIRREISAWVVSSGVGFIDSASGSLLALIWVLRSKFYKLLCKCDLSGSCLSGSPCLR